MRAFDFFSYSTKIYFMGHGKIFIDISWRLQTLIAFVVYSLILKFRKKIESKFIRFKMKLVF
mgnify:CR=1 FL=1